MGPLPKVGSRACIAAPHPLAGKYGTVRFVGPTTFGGGDWVGLEMDDRVGKHDGSVNGVRFFSCAPRSGMFWRPNHLKFTSVRNCGDGPVGSSCFESNAETGGDLFAAVKETSDAIRSFMKLFMQESKVLRQSIEQIKGDLRSRNRKRLSVATRPGTSPEQTEEVQTGVPNGQLTEESSFTDKTQPPSLCGRRSVARMCIPPELPFKRVNIRGNRINPEMRLLRSTGASRTKPRSLDFGVTSEATSRWHFDSVEYNGSFSYHTKPEFENVCGPIAEGLQRLRKKPTEYEGLMHRTEMISWPKEKQQYKLVKRTGSGLSVNSLPNGPCTYVSAKYFALERSVQVLPDAYTDIISVRGFRGNALSNFVLPGRGMGGADVPSIKIIGDIDPSDVVQGRVGNRWLMSAISALSEYNGAVTRLFRKTPDLQHLPMDSSNSYTVTLYDLPTWAPVDIIVDERLFCEPGGGNGLLGCLPSASGELWMCYLEKAVVAHCGGWDSIDGGNCNHAWRLLTGSRDQYVIRNDGDGFRCMGVLNPDSLEWEPLENSPHGGFQGLWPMPWPEVGGGGGRDLQISQEDLFERMCAWIDMNYLLSCSSRSRSNTVDRGGVVDDFAYTVLDCVSNAGGTDIDLVKIRNPWRKGEFTSSRWNNWGGGWDEFPKVKEACKPCVANDGVCWLERDEFFKYFGQVFLCAKNMVSCIGHALPEMKTIQRSAGVVSRRPSILDWSGADPSKWEVTATEYSGAYSFVTQPEFVHVSGPIAEGESQLKENPTEFLGMTYQASMTTWPEDQQEYKLIKRNKSGFCVESVEGGPFIFTMMRYIVLAEQVDLVHDLYSETMTYRGELICRTLSPGRGMGCADVPGIKVIGDVDPHDISQGEVGDCWLLSSLSAMAEYPLAVNHLFRKTDNILDMPLDEANSYTLTLYDIPTWSEVDIVVDERLCCRPTDNQLLGCHPSARGELWMCYIEKAVAAHCGGWDKIEGGQCTHGWRLFTGCKDQCTFRDDGSGFRCLGTLNPNNGEWESLANAPNDGSRVLWPMPWPAVGGGGSIHLQVDANDLFQRMCAWKNENYLMCAGTRGTSNTEDHDGIVDGHAYTILACISEVAGTEFDMIRVRNPWGSGEITSSMWNDNGPGWDEYPNVEQCLKPLRVEDGIFWLSKDEFFEYFTTIYLCPVNMVDFLA
eukprot:TRINITY_DN48948_c0_g1_i1.p1 TRINITY_DN48948_c0_g1~~TRINITY_DN48948_c0_g1_i1.p1  ORF type:complete len:1175 (+),score=100.56 TRINITY_DN48948_c0_g1_i1:103-3627(+)